MAACAGCTGVSIPSGRDMAAGIDDVCSSVAAAELTDIRLGFSGRGGPSVDCDRDGRSTLAGGGDDEDDNNTSGSPSRSVACCESLPL